MQRYVDTNFEGWLEIASPNDAMEARELHAIIYTKGSGQRYSLLECDGEWFLKDQNSKRSLRLASAKAQHAFRTLITKKLVNDTLVRSLPKERTKTISLTDFM